jgi:hypothetical protein
MTGVNLPYISKGSTQADCAQDTDCGWSRGATQSESAPGSHLKRSLACRSAWAVAALIPARLALGEELAGLAGETERDNARSYAYELEYRQELFSHAGASFTYLNEGHLLGNHRDGVALQLWIVSPRWSGFDLALAAGPYVYFDTRSEASTVGFSDYHSVAEMYTASLSYYWSSNWFLRLNLNQVIAPGNLDTRTLLLGFGTRLDSLASRLGTSSDGDAASPSDPGPNELGVFGGQSIINSDDPSRTSNFGIEYRRRMARHVILSAAWLNEAVGPDGRRNGLSNEAWLVTRLHQHVLSVGIGAGPYVALQRYRTADGRSGGTLQGLASMTVSWQLSHRWNVRARWDRVFTQDDQDRDIVSIGVGYSWGGR